MPSAPVVRIPEPLAPLARGSGGLLAAGIGALGAALGRTKPFHPRGEIHRATVERVGSASRSGVPWLDEPGETPALVRLSRGIGLPNRLPDIPGLAIRLDLDGKPADLLLAGTGTGTLGRLVLHPRRDLRGGPLTSLLPYRSPSGPLWLAGVPDGERDYELRWSAGTGDWIPFALLHLGSWRPDDRRISFDPVLNTLPGLTNYDWVRRLREPAYRMARARSGRPEEATTVRRSVRSA